MPSKRKPDDMVIFADNKSTADNKHIQQIWKTINTTM